MSDSDSQYNQAQASEILASSREALAPSRMRRDLSQMPFYISQQHDCSYLQDQQATSLFADPRGELDSLTYSQLSELGFRRSGKLVYKPRCKECSACIPIRILVNSFRANKSQKRCRKKNRDLSISVVNTIGSDEQYLLFEKYIRLRHADGSMYPASRPQFDDFLANKWESARFVEYRDSHYKLICVALYDELINGLSAVYTWFDPQEERRSLGVFSILTQIDLAQRLGKDYLFLGYWIKNSQKMAYKINYRPFQLLLHNQWVNVREMSPD